MFKNWIVVPFMNRNKLCFGAFNSKSEGSFQTASSLLTVCIMSRKLYSYHYRHIFGVGDYIIAAYFQGKSAGFKTKFHGSEEGIPKTRKASMFTNKVIHPTSSLCDDHHPADQGNDGRSHPDSITPIFKSPVGCQFSPVICPRRPSRCSSLSRKTSR